MITQIMYETSEIMIACGSATNEWFPMKSVRDMCLCSILENDNSSNLLINFMLLGQK